MRSEIIKESILDSKEDEIEFNVNKVNGDILKKIVEYLEHYKNEEPKEIERPLPSLKFEECVDKWDFDYIDINLDTVFEIILASNYLNIKPLLELASAKIASLNKGKTTEEIRKLYGISNDFTPEEEPNVMHFEKMHFSQEEQQIIEENK